jgi:hypothetical protein
MVCRNRFGVTGVGIAQPEVSNALYSPPVIAHSIILRTSVLNHPRKDAPNAG